MSKQRRVGRKFGGTAVAVVTPALRGDRQATCASRGTPFQSRRGAKCSAAALSCVGRAVCLRVSESGGRCLPQCASSRLALSPSFSYPDDFLSQGVRFQVQQTGRCLEEHGRLLLDPIIVRSCAGVCWLVPSLCWVVPLFCRRTCVTVYVYLPLPMRGGQQQHHRPTQHWHSRPWGEETVGASAEAQRFRKRQYYREADRGYRWSLSD